VQGFQPESCQLLLSLSVSLETTGRSPASQLLENISCHKVLLGMSLAHGRLILVLQDCPWCSDDEASVEVNHGCSQSCCQEAGPPRLLSSFWEPGFSCQSLSLSPSLTHPSHMCMDFRCYSQPAEDLQRAVKTGHEWGLE
jgi:hypothetical protein